MQILFDGQVIKGNETPGTFYMERNDGIDAILVISTPSSASVKEQKALMKSNKTLGLKKEQSNKARHREALNSKQKVILAASHDFTSEDDRTILDEGVVLQLVHFVRLDSILEFVLSLYEIVTQHEE